MNRIQELRWQQRNLPEHIQHNLSPSERQVANDLSSALCLCNDCADRRASCLSISFVIIVGSDAGPAVLNEADIVPQMQYFEAYSRTLQRFMRNDTGVGMELTLVRSFITVRWYTVALLALPCIAAKLKYMEHRQPALR